MARHSGTAVVSWLRLLFVNGISTLHFSAFALDFRRIYSRSDCDLARCASELIIRVLFLVQPTPLSRPMGSACDAGRHERKPLSHSELESKIRFKTWHVISQRGTTRHVDFRSVPLEDRTDRMPKQQDYDRRPDSCLAYV